MRKQKPKRLSLAPKGAPGTGPGWHRSASTRGTGRLDRALKRSRKTAVTTPEKSENPKAGSLAKWENEGGEVAASSSPVKRPKTKTSTKAKKESSKADEKSPPPKKARKIDKSGPAPSIQSPIDTAQQKRAQTAAKDARKKEAGLESRRIGEASASGKRAQARRDSNQ